MIGMRGIVFCFICICFFPAYSQNIITGFQFKEKVRSVKIPVEIQNNLILLPIKINHSFDLNFIMDTGVRTSILTEPFLTDFLSLDTFQTINIRGLGEGSSFTAYLAPRVTIEAPGLVGRYLNLVILPEGLVSYSEMFGKPVYGIIGYDLLKNFVTEINYQQKYIRLIDPYYFKPKKKWTKVALNFNRGKPYIGATILQNGDEEIEASWLLDTGSSQALSMYYPNVKFPEPNIRTLLGRGLNGNIYGTLGRVSKFVLDKYEFEGPIAGFPDEEALGIIGGEIGWYGNIGADILSRFHIYLDYVRSEMYIYKNGTYNKPFYYNLSGIEVVVQGFTFNTFKVSYIRPDSPSYQAGIALDDEIVKINGLSTRDLEIGDFYNQLNRRPGQNLSLTIKRGNSIFKKRFELREEI